MNLFISSFRPLLIAALTILCIEGAVAVVRNPSFAERANYLNWMFGKDEQWHKRLVQTKVDLLTTPSTEIVQVGDSSGFHGVRGDIVTRLLGGMRYINLNCCANTGYDGYYDLGKVGLERSSRPRALVLYVSWNNLPRAESAGDAMMGATKIHDAFAGPWSVFSFPSNALRPQFTDAVYTMGGRLTPRRSSWLLGELDQATVVERQGWLPERDVRKGGSKRDAFFSGLCGTGTRIFNPARFQIRRTLDKFASLAEGYGAKLIVIFHPLPCARVNSEMIEAMRSDVSALKRDHPTVAVYPETFFEHWDSYDFVGADHLRTGYEGLNSLRVARFVGHALNRPLTEDRLRPEDEPPVLIDLASAPQWVSAEIDDKWQATGLRAVPLPSGLRRLEETEKNERHHIETRVAGATPGFHIVSVRFKPLGQRQLRLGMEAADGKGVGGYVVCDPTKDSVEVRNGVFDADMSTLDDGWVLCWGSFRLDHDAMMIGMDILPVPGGVLNPGKPTAGILFDKVQLHLGQRPATPETGGLAGNPQR